jgi:hypothetical protein
MSMKKEKTLQMLIFKAKRKYKDCIMFNEWNKPTHEQEEIIAMKAQIAAWIHPKQKKDILTTAPI